jgi:nitrate reductase NapE component
MAVIYCNSCNIGVHYIDICLGGKNGKPRFTGKKLKRIERWNSFGFLLLMLLHILTVLVVGLAGLLFIKVGN